MNFEAVIGLELHVEMKTKSKMFSSAPVTFGNEPNTNVAPFDMAFPGTMPTVNKQAVINAIRVSHALHMNIDNELWFDRKNYFYSDLPKGYQITQENRPIGSNGYLEIETQQGNKKIGIERLHLEEDTCKQIHYKDRTLLDYNRAGIPLVEIVSKPEIKTGEEAMKYVEKIRSIVSFLDVSDGKMEEGSLRCDVNVSIMPVGSKKFGTKVEIKNLNTLANIKRAIDYEIKRQQKILLSGQLVQQETRRFDETIRKTVLMRVKTDVIDYKCFTEPNILPIKLSKGFIDNAINTSPELAEEKYKRYRSIGLNEYDSNLLISNKDNCEYFDRVVKAGGNAKLAANWILVDIQAILKKKDMSIREFSIGPEHLATLLIAIQDGKVSNKQARGIFKKMLEGNQKPESLINELGKTLLSDENELKGIVKDVLDENPQSIEDYKKGKDRAVGYLVAQVMKKTNGKANPALTNQLIIKEIKEK